MPPRRPPSQTMIAVGIAIRLRDFLRVVVPVVFDHHLAQQARAIAKAAAQMAVVSAEVARRAKKVALLADQLSEQGVEGRALLRTLDEQLGGLDWDTKTPVNPLPEHLQRNQR